MEQEIITEKLIRYIEGKLTETEKADIQQWLDNDPNLYAEYEQLKQIMHSLDQSLPEVPSDRLTQRYETWLDQQLPSKTKVFFWKPIYRIAASIVLFILAGSAWLIIESTLDQKEAVARLQQELAATKQLMMDQLHDHQSASQRMLGVYAANALSTADDEIIEVLAKTMESDASSNVRMAALEALSRFYHEPKVRQFLINSMTHQKDPVVQIALIQLLVEMKEKTILSDLENLTRENHAIKAVKDEAYKGIFKLT